MLGGGRRRTYLSKTSKRVRDDEVRRRKGRRLGRRHAFCILPYEYVIRTSLDGFRLRRSRADKFTVNICSPLWSPEAPGWNLAFARRAKRTYPGAIGAMSLAGRVRTHAPVIRQSARVSLAPILLSAEGTAGGTASAIRVCFARKSYTVTESLSKVYSALENVNRVAH